MQILQADKVAGSAINQIERILGVPIPEGKRTTAEWKRWWQNTFFADATKETDIKPVVPSSASSNYRDGPS